MIALPFRLSSEQYALIEDIAKTEGFNWPQRERFYQGITSALYGRGHEGPITAQDIERAVRRGLLHAAESMDELGY
jgi:hypothetical protein